MTPRFSRAIWLAALLFPLSAWAQQQVSIFAFQDASCGAWSKSKGNQVLRAQYDFWIRGFVSGHNYADPSRQVTELPASTGLYAYLDRYCNDNPSLTFVGGALQLVQDLRQPVPAKAPSAKAPATKKP
jgi:hypothetical protein